MYVLELCNNSLGAVHKPCYFQMLFSGDRKGVCHFNVDPESRTLNKKALKND